MIIVVKLKKPVIPVVVENNITNTVSINISCFLVLSNFTLGRNLFLNFQISDFSFICEKGAYLRNCKRWTKTDENMGPHGLPKFIKIRNM